MNDEHEIIDEDLDYVLLFDEEGKQINQKKGSGCLGSLLLLVASISIGIVSILKFVG